MATTLLAQWPQVRPVSLHTQVRVLVLLVAWTFLQLVVLLVRTWVTCLISLVVLALLQTRVLGECASTHGSRSAPTWRPRDGHVAVTLALLLRLWRRWRPRPQG